jgi:hypothetical protein
MSRNRMGRPKAPRPGMPTWLPPAFTAPCRKSQVDAKVIATAVPFKYPSNSACLDRGAMQECGNNYMPVWGRVADAR